MNNSIIDFSGIVSQIVEDNNKLITTKIEEHNVAADTFNQVVKIIIDRDGKNG